MIEEIPVKGAPSVVAPDFKCDYSLGEIPEPLPRGAFFMGIIGSAGSGKSSALVSLLTARKPNRVYRNCFENVFFICPKTSRDSLQHTLFDDHDPAKIYDELNRQNLEEILSIIEKESEEDYSSLICIDDCAVDLKNRDVERLLRKIVNNRRHLRTSIIILTQTYSSIPLSVRKTFSHFLMFKSPNRKEFENLFNELLFKPKDVADEIMQTVFREKRDFLFGNCLTGHLYRNFNSLLKIE